MMMMMMMIIITIIVIVIIMLYRSACGSGNILVYFAEGSHFESGPEHRLS